MGVTIGKLAAVGDVLVVDTANCNGAVLAWWGPFTGVGLAFEACYEPSLTVWIAVSAAPVAGGGPVTSLSTQTANNAYEVYAPGSLAIRARLTAITTGPVNIRGTAIVLMQDIAPAMAGGSVGITAISSSSNTLIGDVSSTPRATSSGLASIARLLSAAASTNATLVKNAAGRLYKVRGYNAAAAVRYLKFYNKASAPTVGTDTPIITIALKPAEVFDLDLIPIGEYFSTGIAFAITTGSADADTGALTAADVVGMVVWYA